MSLPRRSKTTEMTAVWLAVLGFVAVLATLLYSPWRAVTGEDFITSRGFAVNKGPALTLDQAQALPYTTFSGYASFSNTPHEHWLRLEIRHGSQPITLRLQPPYLESAVVYQQRRDGTWLEHRGGTRHPHSMRPIDGFNLNVPLLPASEAADESPVFVRINSITSGVLVDAIAASEAARFEQGMIFAAGIYQGLLLIMLLISVLAYITTREPLWLASFMLDSVSAFFSATQLGIFQRFFVPNHPTLASELYLGSLLLLVVAHALFWPQLMRLFSVPRWVSFIFYGGLFLLPLSVVFVALGERHLLLLSANLVILTFTLGATPFALLARHESPVLLNTYRLLLSIQLVIPTYWVGGALLGFDLSSTVAIYSVAPSNLLLAFFILLILTFHTNKSLRERVQLRMDKAEFEARFASERDSRLEATGFLSLVIHEVKSPLNHIRLAISNLLYDIPPEDPRAMRLQRVNGSVTAIDDILERTLELDAAAAGRLPINLQKVDLRELVHWTLPLVSVRNRVELHMPGPVMVNTDSQLMGLMVKNLLDNALQHSPPNSKVRVALTVVQDDSGGFMQEPPQKQPSAQTILAITNKVGPLGYPDLSRLFGKSYHGASVAQHTGLGLGLFWVSEVAKRLGVDLRYRIVDEEIEFSLCFHHSP